MPDVETITVQCAVCPKTHKYALKIEREIVVHMITPGMMYEPPRMRTFTHVFTCLTNGQKYQARISLSELPSAEIKSIAVQSESANA